jgi:hypothetical protein
LRRPLGSLNLKTRKKQKRERNNTLTHTPPLEGMNRARFNSAIGSRLPDGDLTGLMSGKCRAPAPLQAARSSFDSTVESALRR